MSSIQGLNHYELLDNNPASNADVGYQQICRFEATLDRNAISLHNDITHPHIPRLTKDYLQITIGKIASFSIFSRHGSFWSSLV